MKFSEAILMGSTLLRPMAGEILVRGESGWRGCALGMVNLAWGSTVEVEYLFRHPWLSDMKLAYPCACPVQDHNNVPCVVAHLFDWHVMGDQTWTLGQLVDWVRSVEPEEPSEIRTEPVGEPLAVAVG